MTSQQYPDYGLGVTMYSSPSLESAKNTTAKATTITERAVWAAAKAETASKLCGILKGKLFPRPELPEAVSGRIEGASEIQHLDYALSALHARLDEAIAALEFMVENV